MSKIIDTTDSGLLIFLIVFLYLSIYVQLVKSIIYFPVNIVSIPHIVKKVKPHTSWASFYDYSLDGVPNYSKNNLTAASRVYPKGTKLKVTGVNSKEWVIVRTNDYGPEPCLPTNNYQQSGSPEKCIERDIDLSSYAFGKICNFRRGLCEVNIEKL